MKTWKLIACTQCFEGCARCVRKRKQQIKHISKCISKSIGKQCKIYARNTYTKNTENDQDGTPEWNRKRLTNRCRDLM